MKKTLSIKATVILAFLFFTFSLILGYSILSARFFSHGVARVITDSMENTIETYHISEARKNKKDFDYWGSFRITTNWEYMPKTVKRSFPTPIPPTQELFVAKSVRSSREPGPDYYVMASQRGNTTYYVSQWAGFSTPLGTFGWNSNDNIRLLIVISCFIGIGTAIFLWLIIRQTSRPMASLNQWANQLDIDTIKQAIPDFYYRELNDLAFLLCEKIAAEQQQLEKDQQFLHFASHELRTPITIISQNIEVLEKIRFMDTEKARTMETNAIKRLGRASENMGELIETLLWVGRGTVDDLPEEKIRLDLLIEDLAHSLNFLLKGKEIKVTLDIRPTTVSVAETPLRIVLSNLIRNAYHHSAGGKISIKQNQGQITITNSCSDSPCSPDSSFGFGLHLTSKLVRKMRWTYLHQTSSTEHSVTVNIRHSQ